MMAGARYMTATSLRFHRRTNCPALVTSHRYGGWARWQRHHAWNRGRGMKRCGLCWRSDTTGER